MKILRRKMWVLIFIRPIRKIGTYEYIPNRYVLIAVPINVSDTVHKLLF